MRELSFRSLSSPDKIYVVREYLSGLRTCNCPGWTMRANSKRAAVRDCKHVQAAQTHRRIEGYIGVTWERGQERNPEQEASQSPLVPAVVRVPMSLFEKLLVHYNDHGDSYQHRALLGARGATELVGGEWFQHVHHATFYGAVSALYRTGNSIMHEDCGMDGRVVAVSYENTTYGDGLFSQREMNTLLALANIPPINGPEPSGIRVVGFDLAEIPAPVLLNNQAGPQSRGTSLARKKRLFR